MKRTMRILSQIFLAGIMLLTIVQSTTITSSSYNAETKILTITFSDSIKTGNVLFGRMAFDDDNGGPRPDVIFSGGTVLNEDSLSDTLQISLIYGGIIDQYEGKELWGNDLALVNALESMDFSSLQLVIEEGAFISDNAEPFEDTDGNGYSPAEQFTDLNGDLLWTPEEPFEDTDGNGYSPAEQFTECGIEADTLICETDDNWDDNFGNGEWDGAEEFTDCGVNTDGTYICDNDDDWDDNFGNFLWDGVENFEDGSRHFPEDGFWTFEDSDGNGRCDNSGPPPNWECEPFVDCGIDDNGIYICENDDNWDDSFGNGLCDQEFDADGDGVWFPGDELTDVNGNNVWDDAEEFTDCGINDSGIYICENDIDWDESFGNGVWDVAEPLVDFDGDNEFDEVSEQFTDCGIDDNGIYICENDIGWDESFGNDVWDQYETNSNTTLPVMVSRQGVNPDLISAMYDANTNKLTLIFDKPVQFDQIPEDESFLGGPGNGVLNSGEDRNGNGVLDMETNVKIFKVGFTDSDGNTSNLEGLDSLAQTADSDTMEIFLTRSDSKSLETTLDIFSMSVNLSEGAFVDTFYNFSAEGLLPVTSAPDTLPFLADSAEYNISENTLLIFFRSKETNQRKVVVDPAPIYSKIALSVGGSSMNLSGINGEPDVNNFDIFLRIKQLTLVDQKSWRC